MVVSFCFISYNINIPTWYAYAYNYVKITQEKPVPCKIKQVQWEKIISPCEDKMNWLTKLKSRKNITYAPKTVVTINEVTNTETYKLKILTFNKEGVKKTIGGDLWLVKIKSTSISFSIHLIDNMDGSYEGDFSTPQAGNYIIDIILQYSLCHGILDPPLDWFKLGNFQGLAQKVQLDEDDFIKTSLPNKYFVVKSNNNFFYPCDYKLPATCTHLNSKYGYWENLEYRDCWEISNHYSEKVKTAVVDTLAKVKLDTLIIYGDSMAKLFYNSISKKPICTNLFTNCTLVYTWAYIKGRYSTEDEDSNSYDGKDFNETIFFRGISDTLNDLPFLSRKNVLVINFGLHQLVNLSWERMKRLFYLFLDFVAKIKIQLGKRTPLIIWKSITEPGQIKAFRTSERFMTTQRAHLWNDFTIHEACKRGLPILHVYHMSASFPKGTYDRCHYHESAFYPAEKALYNYLNNLVET